MEKLNIDRKITERADEFAEREYECGADERAHLSKGYYWGYKDAQKDLALTWEDVAYIVDTFYVVEGSVKEKCEEVLRRFNGKQRMG